VTDAKHLDLVVVRGGQEGATFWEPIERLVPDTSPSPPKWYPFSPPPTLVVDDFVNRDVGPRGKDQLAGVFRQSNPAGIRKFPQADDALIDGLRHTAGRGSAFLDGFLIISGLRAGPLRFFGRRVGRCFSNRKPPSKSAGRARAGLIPSADSDFAVRVLVNAGPCKRGPWSLLRYFLSGRYSFLQLSPLYRVRALGILT